MVREKESGSVQQIYVSPLKSWEFIAGKMVAYVAALTGILKDVGLSVLWPQGVQMGALGGAILLAGAFLLRRRL